MSALSEAAPDTIAEVLAPPGQFSTLFQELGLTGIFERMDLAENEIAEARQRSPHASDQLYHSFKLLTPTHDRMEYEPVYRASV